MAAPSQLADAEPDPHAPTAHVCNLTSGRLQSMILSLTGEERVGM